jgi:hypothetical protein
MFAKTLAVAAFTLVVAGIPNASAAPALALPLGDAGCNAADEFEALCTVYETLGLPLADAGCHPAAGFEALCLAFDAVTLPQTGASGLPAPVPSVFVDCVGLYPWSVVCDPVA